MPKLPGRPRLPDDDRRTVRFTASLTPTEAKALEARAEQEGVTPVNFMRDLVLQEVQPSEPMPGETSEQYLARVSKSKPEPPPQVKGPWTKEGSEA